MHPKPERFIHQKQRRIVHECANEGDTLTHTARELAGVLVHGGRQAELLEKLVGSRLDLLLGQAANVGLQHDVAHGAAELEQQVILEGNPDVGDGFRYGLAVNDDIAAGCA